jgi:hypothetical protein
MALVNRVQYDQFSPGKMVIRQTPVSFKFQAIQPDRKFL